MTDLEILMMDDCTRSEAKKHLERGTVVFEGEDFEEHFEDYMWDADAQERERYKIMIEEKKPVTDWGVVEHEGKTWYIMYVL